MWLSSMAERRLWAEVTAWVSPVRWRFSISMGTTWLYPPPAAPPLMPKVTHGGLAYGYSCPLADVGEGLPEAHGGGGLPLTKRCGRDGRYDHVLRPRSIGQFLYSLKLYLGYRVAVGFEEVFLYTHRGGYLVQRFERGLPGDLKVVRHFGRVNHPGSSDFAATRGLRRSHVVELLAPPRLGPAHLVKGVDVEPEDLALRIRERGGKALDQAIWAV